MENQLVVVARDGFFGKAHADQVGPALLDDLYHFGIERLNINPGFGHHQVGYIFLGGTPIDIDDLNLLLAQAFGESSQADIDDGQGLVK
jgi:hypothetical protein